MAPAKVVRMIGVKFEGREYNVLKERAAAEDRKIGPFVRILVREALEQRGVKL